MNESAHALAHRLRALREREWNDVKITQRQLAQALSGEKPVSVPLISSWESARRPVVPPAERLAAYARFFASRRSVEQRPFRLLGLDELTDAERGRRDELLRDLLAARATASLQQRTTRVVVEPLGGPWRFDDAMPVTMVCAEVPDAQRQHQSRPEDPQRAFAELHALADLDPLFELHGHVRAANPASVVTVRSASALDPEDYTNHLVVLGGVDWNTVTRNLLRSPDAPVEQISEGDLQQAFFRARDDPEHRRFHAQLAEDGTLIADVGHFFRGPNPFHRERTLTICNGIYGRGVLGAVRALTDPRFRDRNAGYVDGRFANAGAYSILMLVRIVDGVTVTPDWTQPDVRLHEWMGLPEW